MVETTPKHYLYGAIIFTMFVLGAFSLMSTLDTAQGGLMSTGGNSSLYYQWNHTFNKYDQLNSSLGGIQSSIENDQTDVGLFRYLDALVNTAWTTLKRLFSIFGFVGDIFTGLTSMFGVPVWFGTSIILLVVVMIAFTIYGAIFQQKL